MGRPKQLLESGISPTTPHIEQASVFMREISGIVTTMAWLPSALIVIVILDSYPSEIKYNPCIKLLSLLSRTVT